MGLIARLFGQEPLALPLTERLGGGAPQASAPSIAYEAYSLSDPRLIEFMRGGRTGVAGVAVSDRMALRNSTFFRAMSLISGSMGMLPIHLLKRDDEGSTEKAREHPLFDVLWRKPNAFMSASQFKSYMQLVALLDGNAFALVVRVAGKVTSLIPLPRRSVTPKLSATYDLTFQYVRPTGGMVTLQQSDIFHFRGPVSLDGLTGVSLLDVAADTLGLAVQAERAAGRLLSKGNMAGGSLETDKQLGNEAIQTLKASMRENYSGPDGSGDWMVLEEGLKAKPFAGSARDAQLAEIRKQEAEEMARFTGVPRPLLMFDETSWGSGIEQLGQYFVTYCLAQWFVIWEEAIWLCLLTPAEQKAGYFAKFNAGGLLRGSLKDQAEFWAKALGAGGSQAWGTPDEARDNFDQNKIDGGDELPGRMASEDPADPAPAPQKESAK